MLIVDSILEIPLVSRWHPTIQEVIKVLEVVKYIKDNNHDGKSEVTTIENEKFVDDNNVGGLWILCGGFVPIYKEAFSVQESVTSSVKPLGINLQVKLCQTGSDSFSREILEIEGCYMDKMNAGIQCRPKIVLVEMFMKFGLVSWKCGSTFCYAIIEWCDRNEVYEPTIDNLGDTWAEKVQPNHATLFLDLSSRSHNIHVVKRIHIPRMIIGYDTVGSDSLFAYNVAVIIGLGNSRLDLAKVKMMFLYPSVWPKQRDSGESEYPWLIIWFEGCWRSFPTICSQLSFVYDRGKFLSPSIWVQLMSGLSVLKHSTLDIGGYAQQGMCVEVLKYFRSMRFLVHICSRIFMSWFIACVNQLVWPNGKEMSGCSLRYLVERNHLLSTALIELLSQFLNNVRGTLEEKKPGFAFGMMSLYTIILNIPWNLGELNFSMAPTICIYCWSDLFFMECSTLYLIEAK
jgi:hypothetical protein